MNSIAKYKQFILDITLIINYAMKCYCTNVKHVLRHDSPKNKEMRWVISIKYEKYYVLFLYHYITHIKSLTMIMFHPINVEM